MLSYCKNCGTHSILYDPESLSVICEGCEGEIANVTQFTVKTLISLGKTKKKKKESFVFRCNACGQQKQASLQSNVIVGKDCSSGNCDLNISDNMKHALKQVLQKNSEYE